MHFEMAKNHKKEATFKLKNHLLNQQKSDKEHFLKQRRDEHMADKEMIEKDKRLKLEMD